jgi:D-alanyl-D-alanine carboxypeptidase (penicillin-binding protein 5/6)
MNRKIVSRETIVLFLFSLVFYFTIGMTTVMAVDYPFIESKSAILIDAENGSVYYEVNIDEQISIASLTKLMSVYVVLEEMEEQELNLRDTLIISERAASLKKNFPAASGAYYNSGSKFTYELLINMSLVASDNTAIIALAEDVSGSEANHVEKMNSKAEELGMHNTNFVNVTGLDNSSYGDIMIEGTSKSDYNISTAHDLAILCYNLIHDYPEILTITEKKAVNLQGYPYKNTNEMIEDGLHYYSGVRGLKTGPFI